MLQPLEPQHLKEQQRYVLIVAERTPPEAASALALAAELERRTTIPANGRRIVRLGGLFEHRMPAMPEGGDPIADALDDLRQDRAAHLEAQSFSHKPSRGARTT